jgi:hypothetical protein
MIRYGRSAQSRSGCSFPKVPARPRARRSRFWGCRAITSRSAIPRLVASRRFSRFVRKFHRCPGLRDDPAGFLAFVEKLLAARHFDVLLPIHEQGFCLRGCCNDLKARRAGAAELSKAIAPRTARPGSAGCSIELRLPQPADANRDNPPASCARPFRFPSVVKTSVGTASRGIWFVRNDDDLKARCKISSAQAMRIRR